MVVGTRSFLVILRIVFYRRIENRNLKQMSRSNPTQNYLLFNYFTKIF